MASNNKVLYGCHGRKARSAGVFPYGPGGQAHGRIARHTGQAHGQFYVCKTGPAHGPWSHSWTHGSYQSCVSKQQDWLQVSSCSCWDDRQQHMDGSLHLAVGVATSSNEVWLDTDTESVANTTIEVTLRDPAPQTHACNSDLHLEC